MTASAGEAVLGVACESGGFRCAFVHGVLAGLERRGVRAHIYAAVSASALPAAMAAIGRARDPGLAYWYDAHAARYEPGHGMTEMVLAGIERYAPAVAPDLFEPAAARLLIGVSEVVDAEAAAATQGAHASRLGREQLLAMHRHDDTWARRSLRSVMFDTHARSSDDALTAERLPEVAYATTRMLHAWRLPAAVDGRACIDGSYTIGCPVAELFALGCTRVIAIATGHGALSTNLYGTATIEASERVTVVRPHDDLKTIGVDFTNATIEGLRMAFEIGEKAGVGLAQSAG